MPALTPRSRLAGCQELHPGAAPLRTRAAGATSMTAAWWSTFSLRTCWRISTRSCSSAATGAAMWRCRRGGMGGVLLRGDLPPAQCLNYAFRTLCIRRAYLSEWIIRALGPCLHRHIRRPKQQRLVPMFWCAFHLRSPLVPPPRVPQVLQTLSILIQNLRNQQTVYYLFSNNHINEIVSMRFDFDDDEVLVSAAHAWEPWAGRRAVMSSHVMNTPPLSGGSGPLHRRDGGHYGGVSRAGATPGGLWCLLTSLHAHQPRFLSGRPPTPPPSLPTVLRAGLLCQPAEDHLTKAERDHRSVLLSRRWPAWRRARHRRRLARRCPSRRLPALHRVHQVC